MDPPRDTDQAGCPNDLRRPVWGHREKEIDAFGPPIGGDDLPGVGSELLERVERMEVDPTRAKHAGDGVPHRRAGNRHRLMLGRQQVDPRLAPNALLTAEGLDQERGLVRSGGTLERHGRDQDANGPAGETVQGGADLLAAFQPVEVAGHRVEAGDRLRGQPGPQRHDQIVEVERP